MMSKHPPDRGRVATEGRHPGSMNLDALDVEACIDLMNNEDRLVAEAVGRAKGRIAAFTREVVRAFEHGGRLVYFGAGTSGRLGVLDASECPPTFQSDPEMVVGVIAGGDAALRRSSEGREDDRRGAAEEIDRLVIGGADCVLGIAAGGTTPYVLGALEMAQGRGATTGLLTCAGVESRSFIDHVIAIDTGPELLTGSTRLKAGTATKMALNMITTTAMVQLGKTYENLMVDLRASNAKLRDRAARIIGELTGLDRAASFELLDRAGGAVKVAVLMHRRGATRDDAEAILERCQGRLRAALEGGGG